MKLSIVNIKDLRSKKPVELESYIVELQAQLAELTHLITLQKEKQTHQLSQLKRAIAQAKTIQQQAQGKDK